MLLHLYIFASLPYVLPPFKARQVHGLLAHRQIFMEPVGGLACLYSWVGKPHMTGMLEIIRLGSCFATLRGQAVHGICADGRIFTEPLGCLAWLYSWVGEPHTLRAACLPACHMLWPLLPSMAPIVAPAPLVCVSSSSPPAGSPYLFKYWRGTKPARCQKLYNIT